MKRGFRFAMSLIAALSLALTGTSPLLMAATATESAVTLASVKSRVSEARRSVKEMRQTGNIAGADDLQKRIDRVVTLLAIAEAATKEQRHQLIRSLPAARGFSSRNKPQQAAPRIEQPDGANQPTDLCEDEEGWDECASEQDYEDAEILAYELQADVDQGYADVNESNSLICNANPETCSDPVVALDVAEAPDGSASPLEGFWGTEGNQIPACVYEAFTAGYAVDSAAGKVGTLWNIASRIFSFTARAVAVASTSAVVFTAAAVFLTVAAIQCARANYGSVPAVVSEPESRFVLAVPVTVR